MSVGDYVQRPAATGSTAGNPLKPKSKASYLRMTRTFFRDLQEWEWIPRRFDPATALRTPRSVKALTGPDPRVIADDIWAKLLWAGLNLTAEDLPSDRSAVLPAGADPRDHADLAVQRPAQRRDRPPARRLHPLAARRRRHQRRRPPGPGPRRRLPARRPRPQDRQLVHQARRPADGRGDRGMAESPPRSSRRCSTARPPSRPTSCSPTGPAASPATTSTTRSSRCSAPRPGSPPPTSAGRSPATAPGPRSRRSSTTPRSR